MPDPRVVVYGRRECHLCEEALRTLTVLLEEGYRFVIEEVDIDGDDALLRSYLERIPVVWVDGEIVSELALDGSALRAKLDRVAG